MALRRNMQLCQNLNFSNVISEGNCLQIIRTVKGTQQATTALYPILLNIQYLLVVRPDWEVVYVNKEAKRYAHLLAKLACNYFSESIWMKTTLRALFMMYY